MMDREMLERHDVSFDDITQIIVHTKYDDITGEASIAKTEWQDKTRDYILISDVLMTDELLPIIDLYGLQFIAYNGRTYLAKRKHNPFVFDIRKDATTITATVDYRFGYDGDGNRFAEYKNFRLDSE